MLTLYRSTHPGVSRGYWPGSGLFHEYVPGRSSENALFPRVEMKYEDGAYKVIAEVPGVEKDDVHIDVEGGVLTLKGEKKAQFDEETDQCRCSERYYGTFERSFNLPSDARTDEIEAHLDKGVLTISVPVEVGEDYGKKIEVTVN